jgi:hypothetical protein
VIQVHRKSLFRGLKVSTYAAGAGTLDTGCNVSREARMQKGGSMHTRLLCSTGVQLAFWTSNKVRMLEWGKRMAGYGIYVSLYLEREAVLRTGVRWGFE